MHTRQVATPVWRWRNQNAPVEPLLRSVAGAGRVGDGRKSDGSDGGGAFYRDIGLERLFRDVQSGRSRPLTQKAQARYAGRMALGLDIDA